MPDENSRYNQTVWDELISIANGPALLLDLISVYEEAVDDRLKSMKSSLEIGDLKTLGFEAHSLKSSSAGLGLDSVAEKCARIESLCRDPHTPMSSDALKLIDVLASDVAEAKLVLARLRSVHQS